MSREPGSQVEHDEIEHADVVVVGMGAAGCAAALAAHDAGARVVVLEKTGPGEAGGNTRVSGGGWFHHDDPERAAVYLRALCGDDRPLPEPVVRAWSHGTREVSAWVESLGVEVGPHGHFNAAGAEYPELPGSDCYGGLRCVEGTLGQGRLFAVLEKALHDRGIDVRYETPVARLTTDALTGSVTGVVTAGGERIDAGRGVVLATGASKATPNWYALTSDSRTCRCGEARPRPVTASVWHRRSGRICGTWTT